MNDQEFAYLKNRILKLTNLNLDGYKEQQIRRRLDVYLERTARLNVYEFSQALARDPARRRELIDYLAINVSEFFRDPNQFSYLKTDVLPELKKNRSRLNIWSAACSCGQEPYSLAMYLEDISCAYHILATDIDTSALDKAGKGGPYTDQDIRNIDARYLKMYFNHDSSGYWVKRTLAKNITFKMHNIQSDLFSKGYDLIVCRNVIIYFSEAIRDIIFRKFHESLNPGGILFIGGSEAILHPEKIGFKTMRPSYYIKPQADRITPQMPVLERR